MGKEVNLGGGRKGDKQWAFVMGYHSVPRGRQRDRTCGAQRGRRACGNEPCDTTGAYHKVPFDHTLNTTQVHTFLHARFLKHANYVCTCTSAGNHSWSKVGEMQSIMYVCSCKIDLYCCYCKTNPAP